MSSAELAISREEVILRQCTLPNRVILHAGMTKTGSTALQNLLASRCSELRDQGILFPMSFMTRKDLTDVYRTSGHWDLIRQLSDNDLALFEAEMDEYGEGLHTLLISAEGIFHNASDADLERLAAFLDGCSVTLVISLRSQATWAQSRYYESVTKGFFREKGSYDDFLLTLIEDGRLDYFTSMRRLERFLKPETMVVWSHDKLMASNGFIEMFLKHFGIDLDPHVPKHQSNISKPTPEAIEAHRRLNVVAAGLDSGDYRAWCAEMRRLCENLRRQLPLTFGYQTPSRETKRYVLGKVNSSNEALGKMYLGGESFGPNEIWLDEKSVAVDEVKVRHIYEVGLRMLSARIAHTAKRERLIRNDIAREKSMRVTADQYEVVLMKLATLGIDQSEAKKSIGALLKRYGWLLSYLDELQTKYELMRNSRSWRMTAPYRALGRLTKRLLTGKHTKQSQPLGRLELKSIDMLASKESEPGKRATKISDFQCTPTGARSKYRVDVCIVTTCRWPGGNTSSTLDEANTFDKAGLNVLIVHVPVTISPKISGRYINFVDKIVHAKDIGSIECRVLIVRAPRVIMSDGFVSLSRKIKTDHAVFVVNNSAYRPDGSPVFLWSELKARVDKFPWSKKNVHPLSPAIRQEALSHGYVDLAEEDWHPTFDSGSLPFTPRAALLPPFVIGRHGRDGAEKWLEDASSLLKAYPTGDRYQIRILGGANSVQALLGELPSNWIVYPFGSLDVADYLAKLDVFVYFPHSQLNEAFGRTIMEAIFSGIPCILPPRFKETFGDSAIYSESEDVAAVMERLAADDVSRIRYVTTVRREALKRFESQALFQRLPELLDTDELPQLRDLSPSLRRYKEWVESGNWPDFSVDEA